MRKHDILKWDNSKSGLTQALGFFWKPGRLTKSTHTNDYRELVSLLIEARRRAGLTQQQVADRLEKPQSYIAKVEGSERRIDVVEFVALARAMGADPLDLFQNLLSTPDFAK